MPTKRVSMQKFKEVIRLKTAGLSLRPIATAVRLSLGAVAKYAKAAEVAGLTWPLPVDWCDEALARLLSKPPAASAAPTATPAAIAVAAPGAPRIVAPDFPAIHQELKRKGVTLQLLWHEYRESNDGLRTYAYSQFCERYRRFAKISINSDVNSPSFLCPSNTVSPIDSSNLSLPLGFASRRTPFTFAILA